MQTNEAAAILGRIGGLAGTGKSKGRTSEHCRNASLKRWAKAPPVEVRFWSHVKKGSADECWLWNTNISSRYPMFSWRSKRKTGIAANRVAWMLIHPTDSIEGFEICHTCDNTHCCNPKHLFKDTHQGNMHDMAIKGRWRTGSHRAKGEECFSAKLTESQVKWIRTTYKAGGISERAIARQLGIGWSTVHAILKRRSWKHI